jgi:hypothetical protein
MTFWAHELWISEEVPFLLEIFRRAWDLHGHPLCPLPASSDPQVLLGALLAQPVLPTSFPPPSCGSGATAPVATATVPTLPSKWTEDQRVRLWRTVRDAIRHRQTERVYRLLVGVPRSAAILTEYLSIRVGKDVKSAYIAGTLGLQHILCRHAGLPWVCWPPLPTWVPHEAVVAKWPTGIPVGTLAARRFPIPKHLLPGAPLEPSGFAVLRGCRVWQRLLECEGIDRAASEATGSLVFRGGAEAFEAFYEEVFGATDIPDEWSDVERAKSHPVASVV